MKTPDSGIRWETAAAPVAYPDAVARMERHVADIANGTAPEMIWLLEHPPVYTAGSRTRPDELLNPTFPVHKTGRGGQITYHGPGQRVAYVMLDLNRRNPDIRAFVSDLETWIIRTLHAFQISGTTRPDRPGVWVSRDGREDKIAAIGIRIRRWITFHGISLNVNPDLSHYDGIIPCGIRDHGVTSLADLNRPASLRDVDAALREAFDSVFPPL